MTELDDLDAAFAALHGDGNGTDESEIAAERHAVRLLFDFEPHADDTVCAIARLVRSTSGQFQLDRRYVPPCLSLGAHELHVERIGRIADILLAKSLALGARRSERIEQVAEYGVADVQLFWLLHCIHAAWPQLRFLASNPNLPPERLYTVLAELASALMTFSTSSQLTDIPAYDHVRADEVFAEIESMIRNLLDAIIPSRVVPIDLAHENATTWTGQILDTRIADGAADWYLSVNSTLPAFELVERIPRLCKIGAPDEVDHIVNSALAGIALKAVQRVPAAIPVRLDNQYFALDAASPAHARMLYSQGRFAFIRLLERARVSQQDNARYLLSWTPDQGAGSSLSVQLRAEAGAGPLDVLALRHFTLPSRIFVTKTLAEKATGQPPPPLPPGALAAAQKVGVPLPGAN